jgi:hypothetical protein
MPGCFSGFSWRKKRSSASRTVTMSSPHHNSSEKPVTTHLISQCLLSLLICLVYYRNPVFIRHSLSTFRSGSSNNDIWIAQENNKSDDLLPSYTSVLGRTGQNISDDDKTVWRKDVAETIDKALDEFSAELRELSLDIHGRDSCSLRVYTSYLTPHVDHPELAYEEQYARTHFRHLTKT